MPAASAWVSSAQCVETGEQNLEVNSLAAEAVIMTVRFFCLAISCTASAIGVTGRSITASTFSLSNQRRAMPLATSGLFWVSAWTISIILPRTAPPKSSAAMRAASTEPGPALSA